MAYPTCDNDCVPNGYTKELFAYAGSVDLHISVKPDTHMDSRFAAFCHDTQETIWLNGWMCTFEPVEKESV